MVIAADLAISLLHEDLNLSQREVQPVGRWLLEVNSEVLQITTVEVLKLKQLEIQVTYEFCSDDVPALGVRLKVRILHERVVFQKRLPLLLVFTVATGLSGKLLDGDLVTVVILETDVAEV